MKALRTAGVLVLGLAGLVVLGPRVDGTTATEVPAVPSAAGLNAYLVDAEARFTDITPGTEKHIRWADRPGLRTGRALVYLHGFSGTRQELVPVPDSIAASLGANLYYARLTGHGRDGEALAEATLADWTADAAEAVAIGWRLGDRVILMGTSNGGAIALWAAAQPWAQEALDAVVAVSPNFGPADPRSRILLWPWGRYLAEAVVGRERSWEPLNERHARYSTTRYPTRALLPMMATVRALEMADLTQIQAPVLIAYSSHDQVVSVEAIERAESRFRSGAVQLLDMGLTGDPGNHVIAGDMLSPSTSDTLVASVLAFLRGVSPDS